MRRLVLLALCLLAAGALPANADAARECQGLPVCIPVAGPWVAVPAPAGGQASMAQFLLACPRGTVAAGTDAIVSDRALDVSFLGALGAPVAPGVTTHAAVNFIGTYTGAVRRPSGFQPYLGCVPTQGGGGRATTAFTRAALPPGEPLVRRARMLQVSPDAPTTATLGCARGERVVGATHAAAFPQQRQPPIEWLGDVRAAHRIIDGRVVATATRGDAIPPNVRVVLQIVALCARPG